MWSEYEKYKNQFLQKQLKHLEPQKINEMVNKQIDKRQSNQSTTKLQPSKGSCKSALYFEDRAELAYGFWALPKLMKELASDDNLTQWKAINSLSEYVVNPLNAQRAIKDFGIIRRCQNVFLRIRLKFRKIKYRETGRLLVIFYYLAMHKTGAKKIIEKYRLLDEFYMIVRDREIYMDQIAKILPFLTQLSENVFYLLDTYNIFDKLFEIWNRDICIKSYPDGLWLHLSHILEMVPHKAIEHGFFEILHTRIKGRLFEFHLWGMKCFGLLLRCPEGQQRFLAVDGVKELYTILADEQYKLDSYENVVFALMNGLLAKSSLWRCREFTNLPIIITELSKDKEKYNQQLLCLQTLREMGVMPGIKRFIKHNCLEDLKNIECKTLVNEKERNEIVYWLEREIYHTTELRKEPLIKEMK